MSVSHRKFGDLLEEGIKRVHITRKKPIGYILDEFGYELRPDDSTKGRHALGHWYYKKRIPASMDDVAKLAELIVTNSDVERAWLHAFLDSAGYPEAQILCDRFFIPESDKELTHDPSQTEQTVVKQDSLSVLIEEKALPKNVRSWRLFAVGVTVFLILAVVVYLLRYPIEASVVEALPTATHDLLPISPTVLPKPATATVPIEDAAFLPIPSTPDFAAFDGKCPVVSPALSFEYISPQSFKGFLNGGGSFTVLQSEFNALVQKKTDILDGRVVSIDLTGDGVPEIIVNAVLKKGSVWQILGCDSSQYETLVDINDPGIRYLRFAVDLNGDKLPEIVGYHQTRIESTDYFEFFIQAWNGHQIAGLIDNTRFDNIGRRLPLDITDWQRTVANVTATTRDINGDGIYELVITGGLITPVPTCETRFERQFTEIWAWNGKSFQLSERLYNLPIYRFQRSADGDLAYALKRFDIALEAYQDVLFDKGLYRRDQYLPQLEFCQGLDTSSSVATTKDEDEQLEAYARWHILLINTINDSQDALPVIYQTLQDKFPEGKPGHSYALIASAFWEEYQLSHDIQAACEMANLMADSQSLYGGHMAENMCFLP